MFVLALGGAAPAAQAWTFDWAGRVESDAERLRSPDPAKRGEAVADLAKYDISLTENHLIRALEDRDDNVREQAAQALGTGGSLKAVPYLIDWLASHDPKIQRTAAGALGEIGGPEATAALVRTLGAPDPTVRQRAVTALGAIGRRGNLAVVLPLLPRLDDENEKTDVKIATIGVLEELGDRRAVIPLVALFSHSTTQVKTVAVRAVGRLNDRSAVPALIRLLDDQEEVKLAVVGALGALGAVDALDALTAQLQTGNQAYRQKVAFALGQIAGTPGAGKAGEEAMRTLVENLASPDQRQGAREALRVAGTAAVPALVLHLQGRIKGDPPSAVALLADTADPRATATLAAELERGRVAAPVVLRALGATKDPQALVPVLRALASKDPTIRVAAMESLRPLIGSDARAGDVLIGHLADDDLEIRVLAAEYLGMLRIAAAIPKLAGLVGAGNPLRLRRAAIDALGEIRRPEAAGPLLAVLREGPVELHARVATALSQIADPTAVAPLAALVKADRGPSRHHLVRALAAPLRDKPDNNARKLLRELIDDVSVKVAVAAIAGLAAAKDPADGELLRDLVEHGSSDRRRAAAWALGELAAPENIPTLMTALASRDDRLAGDAAWALGEIASAHPQDGQIDGLTDRWLHTAKYGGWAASINSVGALARTLAALPKDARAKLLTVPRRSALIQLQYHRSRLVRINAAHALGALAGDDAVKGLLGVLRGAGSVEVATAAARAVVRSSGGKADGLLKQAEAAETNQRIKAAIASARTTPLPPPLPRTEWRVFQVVDPGADDAPVRQEAYFLHAADGLVTAAYTDARGEITSEHMPAGDVVVWPASREFEY